MKASTSLTPLPALPSPAAFYLPPPSGAFLSFCLYVLLLEDELIHSQCYNQHVTPFLPFKISDVNFLLLHVLYYLAHILLCISLSNETQKKEKGKKERERKKNLGFVVLSPSIAND